MSNFNLEQIKNMIAPLDEKSLTEAKNRQENLLKPMGSLGILEDISIQMAGINGKIKNKADKRVLFLFGADNGVYEEGVASAPQKLTYDLMEKYADTENCAINVICNSNNTDLVLIDMGIKGIFSNPKIHNHKLMDGTYNFAKMKAMNKETVIKAIETGFSYAEYAKEKGYDIIGNGEVGMGNTTTASACIMAVTGVRDADLAVGRGAGLVDSAFEKKKKVICNALEKHKPIADNIIDILSKVGGLDIAAMTGLYIGAAYYKIPIVIDGVISISAALLAYVFNKNTKCYMFPSHISTEPAYKLASDFIGLKPMLNLGMRLGEGTGCPIAMNIISTALDIISSMKTFDEFASDKSYRNGLKMDK